MSSWYIVCLCHGMCIAHPYLIPIPRRVILRTDHQTPPFLRPSIYRLQNIHQLALILQHPIQLIVISGTKITHHMLIAEEEHDRHGIVEFVHGLEVRHLVQVAEIDGREVLDTVGDFVQDFVLRHAVGVRVPAEADYDEPVFFGENGLVDMPACAEVGEDDGAHGVWFWYSKACASLMAWGSVWSLGRTRSVFPTCTSSREFVRGRVIGSSGKFAVVQKDARLGYILKWLQGSEALVIWKLRGGSPRLAFSVIA
jgi:hypothetical protein